jgi:site-specific DNA recombinase
MIRPAYAHNGATSWRVCRRRMQGQHSHGSVYYRCRFPQEYALANRVEHPRNVIMREDVLIKPLDGWIAGLFRPEYRDATIAAMMVSAVPAQRSPEHDQARVLIGECERKLDQYRRALDAGADPIVVSGWITQTEADRKRLERQLAAEKPAQRATSCAVPKPVAWRVSWPFGGAELGHVVEIRMPCACHRAAEYREPDPS